MKPAQYDCHEIVFRTSSFAPWERSYTTDVEVAIQMAARSHMRQFPAVSQFDVDVAERDPKHNASLDGDMAVLPLWVRVAINLDPPCIKLNLKRRRMRP